MDTYNPFSLKNKTVLITGASSGIGRATAIECSRLGAKVILTARNRELLEESLGLLEGSGHQVIIADLASEEMIDDLVSQLPALDGCVHNAGVPFMKPIRFLNKDEIESHFQINAFAAMVLTQRLVKSKKINRGGSFVFVSSTAGYKQWVPGNAVYSAAKAATNSFMKSTALEMAPRKIRANSVCPGVIETKLLRAGVTADNDLHDAVKWYPLGRYGNPEEVAYAIVYLLSDASVWVTGVTIPIDGGVSLR